MKRYFSVVSKSTSKGPAGGAEKGGDSASSPGALQLQKRAKTQIYDARDHAGDETDLSCGIFEAAAPNQDSRSPIDVTAASLETSCSRGPAPEPLSGDQDTFPQGEEQPAQVERKPATAASEHPLRFLTWNANSLLVRLKYNRNELDAFISDFDPDYIALQEVRIPAAGKKGSPANQSEIKGDTKASNEERQFLLQALQSAPLNKYRVWWSLAETKYAGTAVLLKRRFTPLSVSYTLDGASKAEASSSGKAKSNFGGKRAAHEKDGRAILMTFPGLVVLNTYVPNNGFSKDSPSFERRRAWDARMCKFLGAHVASGGAPLIWCGDLNVSRTDDDVSHPEFFRNAIKPGEPPAEDPLDRGQPAFSINERKRFEEMLQKADLRDAYRSLHKEKDMESGFTWSGNPQGRYQGKRMRVDYFLVQNPLSSRIYSCNIHGRGANFEGFLGSDHCPVTLVLSSLSPG